jgi:hypothetical protein
VLDRINPSVSHLIAHVKASDPSFNIPAKGTGNLAAGHVPANQVVDGAAASSAGGPLSAAPGAGK